MNYRAPHQLLNNVVEFQCLEILKDLNNKVNELCWHSYDKLYIDKTFASSLFMEGLNQLDLFMRPQWTKERNSFCSSLLPLLFIASCSSQDYYSTQCCQNTCNLKEILLRQDTWSWHSAGYPYLRNKKMALVKISK